MCTTETIRSTRTQVLTSCTHTVHRAHLPQALMQILRWQLCQRSGLDSATKQLKFYARTTSVGRPGEVIIGLTDAAGISSLKIVDTVYAPATTYSEYTVYLDAATAGDARIAFVFMRTIGTYDYVY